MNGTSLSLALDKGLGVVSPGSAESLHANGCTVYWDGLVYVEGERAQAPSVTRFLQLRSKAGMQEALKALKGCFLMVIQEQDSSCHVCVDNSGMFAAYASERGVSRSYLDLVNTLGLGWSDLDPVALIEFLQTGNIYFGATHFPGVRKIGFDEWLTYSADGTLKRQSKGVPSIDGQPEHENLLATFEGYARAIEGIPTSVDATGGLDTRTLLAGLYATEVEFETCISGYTDHPDVVLGGRVAQAMGRRFHYTQHRVDNLAEDIESTVLSLDGLRPHVATQHRLNQYQQDRYDRGYTLTLKGMGGELYRDFIWMQDFPFYHSHKTNFSRMHRSRLEILIMPESLLTESYRPMCSEARHSRIEKLEQYRKPINTQSYDNAHCHEFLQIAASRAMSTTATGGHYTQAPLTELFRLQHPYHQARLARFAGRYQKQFITQCSRPLAKVGTTYGTRASSELVDLPGDALGLATNFSRSLVRKLSQVYFNKTLFPVSPANHPETDQRLLAASFSLQAIKHLQERGVVEKSITLKDIPARFQGSFIVAGALVGAL